MLAHVWVVAYTLGWSIAVGGAHAPTPPLIPLSNGVQMPAIACGTGGDTNSSAQKTVAAALGAGFTHIDTAADYGDQGGVGAALKLAPGGRDSIFLTTKIPGCGVPTQGLPPPCQENSAKKIDSDLRQLGTTHVDLLLIHFPPLLGCIPSNCAHMQQQWAALEQAYSEGKARAIGVSNYCEACVQCLLKTAKVGPMVNQVQYHVGMGAGYPETTPGFWKRQNITIMAYSPLAGGKLLKSGSDFAPLGKSLGSKYNVTAAQIALGWIGQPAQFAPTGPMAIVTKSSNPQYLAEDLSLWNWKVPLSDEDREILDKVAAPACVEEAPGGCCKGQ